MSKRVGERAAQRAPGSFLLHWAGLPRPTPQLTLAQGESPSSLPLNPISPSRPHPAPPPTSSSLPDPLVLSLVSFLCSPPPPTHTIAHASLIRRPASSSAAPSPSSFPRPPIAPQVPSSSTPISPSTRPAAAIANVAALRPQAPATVAAPCTLAILLRPGSILFVASPPWHPAAEHHGALHLRLLEQELRLPCIPLAAGSSSSCCALSTSPGPASPPRAMALTPLLHLDDLPSTGDRRPQVLFRS